MLQDFQIRISLDHKSEDQCPTAGYNHLAKVLLSMKFLSCLSTVMFAAGDSYCHKVPDKPGNTSLSSHTTAWSSLPSGSSHRRAVAMYPYTAQLACDLSFKPGETSHNMPPTIGFITHMEIDSNKNWNHTRNLLEGHFWSHWREMMIFSVVHILNSRKHLYSLKHKDSSTGKTKAECYLGMSVQAGMYMATKIVMLLVIDQWIV